MKNKKKKKLKKESKSGIPLDDKENQLPDWEFRHGKSSFGQKSWSDKNWRYG